MSWRGWTRLATRPSSSLCRMGWSNRKVDVVRIMTQAADEVLATMPAPGITIKVSVEAYTHASPVRDKRGKEAALLNLKHCCENR